MISLQPIQGLLGMGLISLLVGCATLPPPPPTMYQWGEFSRQQYNTLSHVGGTLDMQTRSLQAQMESTHARGAVLPPGFRAHLGMLYLSAGNENETRSLWDAEKIAFPESTTYINYLLKRLDARAGKSPP